MVSRDGTEGLASQAQEMGATVLRGPRHCPACAGTLHLGDMEMQELLHELAAHEALVFIAPLGVPCQERRLCPLCRKAHRAGEGSVCTEEQEKIRVALQERLLFDEGFSSLLCR